jgi:hypothetical protein
MQALGEEEQKPGLMPPGRGAVPQDAWLARWFVVVAVWMWMCEGQGRGCFV